MKLYTNVSGLTGLAFAALAFILLWIRRRLCYSLLCL
jgi:hypothetical protein